MQTRSDRPPLKKQYVVAGLLAIWCIWISGIFGNSGVLQAYRLSRARRDLSLRIRALENEKQRLQSSLQALETDPLVQEMAIRETLGFVRQNELVFEFRQ